jgi:hypothetical protein
MTVELQEVERIQLRLIHGAVPVERVEHVAKKNTSGPPQR